MKVLLWPHPSLKTVCDPVDLADPELGVQLAAMRLLMQESGGIGLAANQVGIHKRMLVAAAPGGIRNFLNPRVVESGAERVLLNEGCLSIPGILVMRKRALSLVVEHLDVATGATIVEPVHGQLAHILQHEIEHLDGKVMIDVLPSARRDQIRAHMRTVRR